MMRAMEEDEFTTESHLSPVVQQVINEAEAEPALLEERIETKPDSTCMKILKSSTVHGLVFILFFVIAIPTLIFLFVIENDPQLRLGASSCSVDLGYRVSCGHWNISRFFCLSIRCCHDEALEQCYHFIPSKYGYSTGEGNEVTPGNGGGGGRYLAMPKYTALGTKSVEELKITVQEVDSERVKVILHEPDDTVEEITMTEPKGYAVGIYEDFLGVEIHRSEEPRHLLLTSVLGPLMASEHYWEWTFQITSTHLFGMGGLLIEQNATVNQTFYPNRYNHILEQPMFLAHTRGQWHSVLVDWIGGPLEVTILPSRLIILRMIGGGRIELTLGVGPDPRNAANQMRFTGEDMVVPPRWMLGLHMCRDGVTTLSEAMREYVEFNLKESRVLKFETDCIHENLFLMLANDNPDSKAMEELEKALQGKIMNNILLSIPAQIPVGSTLFNEATALDILYKNVLKNEYVNASYNGLEVAYPDYGSELTISDYKQIVQKIVDAVSKKGPIVGFVLRDNWPDADNIYFKDENEFPYMTAGLSRALSNTLPYNSSSISLPTSHYLSHRSYSSSHLSFIGQLTQQPSVYISPTIPDHPSTHNIYGHMQHVNATWDELRRVMHYTVYHSMFGVGGTGLVTVPVCGNGELWNEVLQGELCVRWWLHAATTALVRVSNKGDVRRDPESLSSKTSKAFVLRALRHRTMLLPYYYTTLFQRQPLLRPMFYDYPTDENTFPLDEQYLVGDALLVAQPLTPKMVVQRVYLPGRKECGGWYEYWEGTRHEVVKEETGKRKRVVEEEAEGLWVEVPIVASDWVMFIASGKIVPRAMESSEDTFDLLLASGKKTCPTIQGEMVFTTQSLYFQADQNKLTISNILEVKKEICTDVRSGLHKIRNLYIYGKLDGKIQTLPIAQDICEHFTTDTVDINLNSGPPIDPLEDTL